MKPSIYAASKTSHAAKWRGLRLRGYNIISTWIDYADGTAVVDWQGLWLACARQAAAANVTLVYVEPGEELRGAYVEMGIAIASGRRIFFVNPGNVRVSDAINHPQVTEFDSLDAALKAIDHLAARAADGVIGDARKPRK